MRGIRAVRPGRPISVIGRVIESYAKRFGYGVVRDYTGHGVGRSFHTKPTILHYDEPRATTLIEPGMTFTVEPMLTLGGYDWDMWDDGWTVVTEDGSWVAQWEHTLRRHRRRRGDPDAAHRDLTDLDRPCPATEQSVAGPARQGLTTVAHDE